MAYGKINVERAVSGGSGLPAQLVNYTMLYDAGDECVDITGGWSAAITAVTPPTVTKNIDNIYIKTNPITSNGSNVYIATTNKFTSEEYVGYYAVLTTGTMPTTKYHIYYANMFAIGTLDSRTDANSISRLDNNGKTFSKKSVMRANYIKDRYLHVYGGSVGTGYGGISVTANFYNMFLVKEDNWQEWISKAGLSTSTYTTLDAVIADSTALTTLMNNKDAVKYMLLNCTGTVMASVIQNENALDIIRDSQYNAMIYENEHWNKFLRMVEEVPESEKTYL